MRRLRIGLLLLCVCPCGWASAATTLSYTLTDLGVRDSWYVDQGTRPFQADYSNAAGQGIGGAMIRSSGVLGGDVSVAWRHEADGTTTPIAPLAGDESVIASAIAANGLVAALSIPPVVAPDQVSSADGRPFLWAGPNLADAIPYLTAGAVQLPFDVNAVGQVVGRAWSAGDSAFESAATQAWLYQDGVTSELDSLIVEADGWHLALADAIDESGRITGLGISGSSIHRYLLTPMAGDDGLGTSVPEPPTSIMAAIIVFAVGVRGIRTVLRKLKCPPWWTK